MPHRPEIDGLRAVAVLAVLVYHARFEAGGVTLLTGGYLGVDVFFVISGYLITRIFLHEGEHFTLGRFYERRVRRILPALLVVLLACLPFAWFVLLPGALVEFADSVVATSLFGSNWLFWSQDPYAAAPSLLKPLLHTWSLAVEEQFYLLYPLLLLAVRRGAPRRLPGVLAGLALASLALAEWTSRVDPAATFFLLPQRLWELLAGAVLALRPPRDRGGDPAGLDALGLALIVGSVLTFDDQTRHPSAWTALPVLGTLLLLRPAERVGWIRRMLGARPAVAVGLVSYSLYLWHQPVFAFARIARSGEPGPLVKLGLLGLCGALAALSWRWIEQPCRDRTRLRLRPLLASLLAGGVLLLAFAGAVRLHAGFPERFPSLADRMAEARRPETILRQGGRLCYRRPASEACEFGAERGGPTWYLLGDSAAERLAPPLWHALRARGARFVPLTANGCYYAPGLVTVNAGRVQCALEVNRARRERLLASPPATVVHFGLLPIYLSGRFLAPHLPPIRLQASLATAEEGARQARVQAAVEAGIRELLDHGHRVVLVYPTPELHFDLARHLLASSRGPTPGGLDRVAIPWEAFRRRSHDADAIYDGLGSHPNLVRVRPEDVLCTRGEAGECAFLDRDALLFADAYHLSYPGAERVVAHVLEAVEAR